MILATANDDRRQLEALLELLPRNDTVVAELVARTAQRLTELADAPVKSVRAN